MMVVTGSEGFIGSHVAKLGIGHVFIDRKELFDVLDLKYLEEGSTVIHLAAISGVVAAQKDPEEAIRTNIMGLVRLIKLCNKSKSKLTFISSCAVTNPQSLYTYTKLWGEELIKRAMPKSRYAILRLGNVYGEGDDLRSDGGSAIHRFKTDKEITIFGDGKQKRNFIYVGDVAQAIKECVDNNWLGTKTIGHENMSIIEAATLFNKPIKHSAKRKGDIVDATFQTDWKGATMSLKEWAKT